MDALHTRENRVLLRLIRHPSRRETQRGNLAEIPAGPIIIVEADAADALGVPERRYEDGPTRLVSDRARPVLEE